MLHAILVSFLTRHSLCLIIFHLYLNLASSSFGIFAESEVLLTILLLKLLLRLLFIPKLTILTTCLVTFLALYWIVFNSLLTLPLALLLKLLNSLILHPFSNHYIGTKSTNAFTTKFSQSTTKHSNLKNPPISTIFSMSSPTLLLVPRLPLLLNALQSTLVSKELTGRSHIMLRFSGIGFS